jgi:TolA-binding protein
MHSKIDRMLRALTHFTGRWLVAFGALLMPALLAAQLSAWDTDIRRQLEEGRDLFDQQLYNASAARFEAILKTPELEPTSSLHAEAMYYRALCAVFLMNEDGEAMMREFLESHPTNPLVKSAILQASEYFFNRRSYRQAMQWLEKLDVRSLTRSEKGDYHFRLGYSYMMSKREDDAQLQFSQIKDQKQYAFAGAAKYYFAHIAYEKGQFTAAQRNFKDLVDDPEFGPVVPYYLVQIAYQSEDYDEVISTGEALLKNPKVRRGPEIAKLVGEALFKKEKYFEALPYLERYANEGGRMAHADYYQLGFARYRGADYEGAMEAFNRITSGNNALAQNAYYHLADCYVKTSRLNKAMAAFRAASQMDFNKVIQEDVSFNYAKLNYETANPYENAISALQEFIARYPNSANLREAQSLLANVYLNTRDYANALKAIAATGIQTAEMREAYQKVSYFRGVEHYQAGQLNDAINLFDQSLRYPINPTYIALATYWTAEALYRMERYEEALKAYTDFMSKPKANQLSEHINAVYGRAYVYFKLNKFDLAANSFRQFADNSKASSRLRADARLRYADCQFLTGRFAQAADAYAQYVSQNGPDRDYASFQRALALGLSNRSAEKIQTLKALIQSGSSRFVQDAMFELGETYLREDRFADALGVFEDYVTRYPQAAQSRKASLNIGVIHRNMDQPRKAVEVLKGVVQKYPSTPEAHEAISFARLVYADMNKIDEYVTWVETLGFANIREANLDSTMYNTGFDYYASNNCEAALKAFGDYLRRYPNGIFALQARYYTAECAWQTGQDTLARRAYTEVANLSMNTYTERSLARAAELNQRLANPGDALKQYRSLLQIANSESYIRQARLGIFTNAETLKDEAAQMEMASFLIADERIPPAVAGRARMLLARRDFRDGKIDEAFLAFTIINTQNSGALKAEAAYYLARIHNLKSQFESSNAVIYNLMETQPGQTTWRNKALLLLAENFWKINDNFQAQYTLDFIIEEQSDPETVRKARELKKQIQDAEEQLQQKREESIRIELDLDGRPGKNEDSQEDEDSHE